MRRTIGLGLVGVGTASLGFLCVLISGGHFQKARAAGQQGAEGDLPGFHITVSPDMPYDVDMVTKKNLEAKGLFPQVQRLFDVYAWETFIGMNWPADPNGNPDKNKKIGDAGPVVWESWKEAYQVYRANGEKPSEWGSPTPPPETAAAAFAQLGGPSREAPSVRLLQMNFKPLVNHAHATVANETFQAFSGPLVDQNGNWVRYEVLMNQPEFDYVVTNQLYNLDGQVIFSQAQKQVVFPIGQNAIGFNGVHQVAHRGAMELKFAWKQMAKTDNPARFFTRECLVKSKNTWVPMTMGLVGMHIAVKTATSPTWIWATFEQVDNVRIDDMKSSLKGYPSSPNFNNPNLPTAPVNVLPPRLGSQDGNPIWDESKNTTPVQVTRVIPIPKAQEELNREAQRLLVGTRFQYYELIGTQWPTGTSSTTGSTPIAPAAPGGQGSALPYSGLNSVSNKTPGNITPVFLTNSTMETYFQLGNQPATNSEEGSPTDTTPVFATESCTGCHYSAAIATTSFRNNGAQTAIFGGSGRADFSWLPSQLAQWKPTKQASTPRGTTRLTARRGE